MLPSHLSAGSSRFIKLAAKASVWMAPSVLCSDTPSISIHRGPLAFAAFQLGSKRQLKVNPPFTGGSQSKTPSLKSTALFASGHDDNPKSFLSTKTATVQFNRTGNRPLSPVDNLLLALTSDTTSILLGSLGILLLLLNRLLSFPEGPEYEASRSRIDLLGVFAAGSVLLNGITKLDVTSVTAERVPLEGVPWAEEVFWNGGGRIEIGGDIVSAVGWALTSLTKCSPARTAVLLVNEGDDSTTHRRRWKPLAMAGVLPLEEELWTSIPSRISSTPILDRMLLYEGNGGASKGGSVAGSVVTESRNSRDVPKESYLPTLQTLPGRVEFTYLPCNTQEVLILPVLTRRGDDDAFYAVVLGGDTAKNFSPRDIAWCREISSWIGDSLRGEGFL